MIPFLRPSVPPVDTYLHHLRGIDASHTYSNFGPLATRFETRIINELFDGEGLALTVSNATAGLRPAWWCTNRGERVAADVATVTA